jgi:hypothetical protein
MRIEHNAFCRGIRLLYYWTSTNYFEVQHFLKKESKTKLPTLTATELGTIELEISGAAILIWRVGLRAGLSTQSADRTQIIRYANATCAYGGIVLRTGSAYS